MSETVYYAIGDVHGEREKFERLLGFIRDDAREWANSYKIVLLGDLIDRGPDSRGVVALALELTRSGEALALKGNHEELMLHAYSKRESIGIYHWATNGGDETIASYKQANGAADDWRDAIDTGHLNWMRELPAIWRDEARGLVFVHAGIDPHTFPACKEEIHLWTRSGKFFNSERWPDRPELEGLTVIHGHTPLPDLKPHLSPRRINVDTGACFGGPLTSVVLAPGQGPRFLRA